MPDEIREDDPRADYVPALAPEWLVPPMLADFECRHGVIGTCDECREESE